MSAKPPFRETDESPKRGSDIRIPLPWSTEPFEASGENVIQFLIWIALIFGGGWHHIETQKEFMLNRDIAILQASYQAQNVCVIRLNEEQRQEDRQRHTFCPDPLEEIRRYIAFKKAERD